MEQRRQVGCIPVRRSADGSLAVLLVTSRETRRWLVPKGWPWPDLPDHLAAAGEAREEAGIVGETRPHMIGTYAYGKRKKIGIVPVLVDLYILEVIEELAAWPEQHQRERRWFTVEAAAAAVLEPELAAHIRQLAAPPSP